MAASCLNAAASDAGVVMLGVGVAGSWPTAALLVLWVPLVVVSAPILCSGALASVRSIAAKRVIRLRMVFCCFRHKKKATRCRPCQSNEK